MKLTPLEVKQQQFGASLRGYDRHEVDDFLQAVAEEMEELTREHNGLKARARQLEERLEEFRAREKNLKETLMTAQKVADDVKNVAEREARMAISNAEMEGERIMQEILRRREKLIGEIYELKRQKVQFETTMRNAIEVHLKMLDALKEHEEEPAGEKKLAYLKQKPGESRSDESQGDDFKSERK